MRLSGTFERRRTRVVASYAAAVGVALATPARADCGWPLWKRYAEQQISADGRVVETAKEARTTSEGQAYALFFAVVAGDRTRFDRVLEWTRTHTWKIAGAPPAWLWGRRDNGSDGVLDENSATDADLWMAYALFAAARRWDNPRYRQLGEQLLGEIGATEVVKPSSGGAFLIPGRRGFQMSAQAYLINPSYAPVPLLRRFAAEQPDGPWSSALDHQVDLMVASTPQGYAPDWYRFDAQRGYSVEPSKGPTGGFDAVRTYLWAGMTDSADPSRTQVLPALSGMARYVAQHGVAPLYVNVESGQTFGVGPIGFTASVLPLLSALGDRATVARVSPAIAAAQREPHWKALRYYDRNLLLFASGWIEGRYRFGANGGLVIARCN